MATYQHDMMHCSQANCQLYDNCYRAWLGKNIRNYGWTTAFYYRGKAVGNDCEFFLDIKDY